MLDMATLINTQDAARELNVHPATLRRWIKERVVTPADRTVGGHARWDLDDLRRQVAAAIERRDSGLPPTASTGR